MKWSITLDGRSIEIEPPVGVWTSIIQSGTDGAARKIGDELDRVAQERELEGDERQLRAIIRDVKGF